MKEELIKFVMERADREYQDDFPIYSIPEWINQFFDQNQPERSKREDFANLSIIWNRGLQLAVQEGCWANEDYDAMCQLVRDAEMRYSEHCGNTVRKVQ